MGWVNKYPKTDGKSESLECPFLPLPAITGSSTHQYSFILASFPSQVTSLCHSFFLQADLAMQEAHFRLKCLAWHKYRERKWKALNWLCKCTGLDRCTDARILTNTTMNTQLKMCVCVCTVFWWERNISSENSDGVKSYCAKKSRNMCIWYI